MKFPTELDTDTELYHEEKDSETAMSAHHNALKDAIKAIEEKVGIDGSSVPASMDYKLALLGSKVKSGTKVASLGSNSVTFNTPFASIPQVVLTVRDSIVLRGCLYQVTAVSTTGFRFNADAAATYAWIATDAGNS